MVDYKKLYERYLEVRGDRKRLLDGQVKILMKEFGFCSKSVYIMEMDKAKKEWLMAHASSHS